MSIKIQDEVLRHPSFEEAHQFEPRSRFCLRVLLGPLEDGNVPVSCPALPGVWSQGSNEREALKNIKEALHGAIAEYLGSSGEIPWKEEEDRDPSEGINRWVWLDVG